MNTVAQDTRKLFRVFVMYGGKFKGQLALHTFVNADTKEQAAEFAISTMREVLKNNNITKPVELIANTTISSPDEMKFVIDNRNKKTLTMVN